MRYFREKEASPMRKEEFKLPFDKWEVLRDENGKNYYEYLCGEDELFFDPQRIGITGKELPGKKTEEFNGKIYEYNLIGDQASKIKVRVKDKSGKEKVAILLDLYNEIGKRIKLGEKINMELLETYAGIIREYFKRNAEADKGRNIFIRDLEGIVNGLFSSIKTNKGDRRFLARVYPSTDTPLDSFGVDFFVEVEDEEKGAKKRINCDVTLAIDQKRPSSRFSHIVIGLIDLPNKNDDKSKERYLTQIKILAQKSVFMFANGRNGIDFHVLSPQSK